MSHTQHCLPAQDSGTESLHERRKAVLTCPRCAHASPPDGDWRTQRCDRGTELRCPGCMTVLTVREQFADSDTPK
ncbi:hypothetical protein [Halovenus halobia]|uniref:hypothetical protein n=1 Tax=Halovenus halobia TaxID=3396622 RepID=UPI003F5534AA